MFARRALVAFLLALNAVLAYGLLVSDHGLIAYLDLKRRHDELSQRLARVDERTRELSQEIRQLKSDRAAMEAQIRKRMHYLKNGEILYTFPSTGAEPQPPGVRANEKED